MNPPNVLLVMTDQQRFDTIRSLGNDTIHTPNLDRLASRGTAFTNAYSPCPVCVPARYVIQSGCEPTRTGVYSNATPDGVHETIARDCGPWLADTMGALGYRTWGVGKFHTVPWDAPLGYEVQLHSEEFYESAAQRAGDSYAAWIAREHPEYDWVEALMGERSDMYYVPQCSPLPPELTVEWWAARRAVELIGRPDPRPYFGFVSFIGPHPPFAPPLPFNRLYDPDRMPDPVRGELAVDHMDEQIPYMNHLVFADDISDAAARQCKARYYGEISYIDHCVGAILDAVEARPDADNTVIAFFTDHGDHLGDHHAWQKESFFEASTRIPLLVSWPARWPGGRTDDSLASLADIFGLCTTVAGAPQLRDGVDLAARLDGSAGGRRELFGFWGRPGHDEFKMMLRTGDWKLIWLANGGRTQLFDVRRDPHERCERSAGEPELVDSLLRRCGERLLAAGLDVAVDGGLPRAHEWRRWPRERIYQFDASRGVRGFPDDPGAALRAFAERFPATSERQTGSARRSRSSREDQVSA